MFSREFLETKTILDKQAVYASRFLYVQSVDLHTCDLARNAFGLFNALRVLSIDSR